jgi:lipopolysaccharide export system permease protein
MTASLRTLDRYVAVKLGVHFAYSLAVLLAIFTVVDFVQELGDVGTGDYGFAEAVWFVFLTLPNQAYNLIPAAALLGSVTCVGDLAAANELIAISAAGISRARLVRSILQPAVVLMIGTVLLGELVAAPLVKQAQAQRTSALSGGLAVGTGSGFWARDGSTFVNARSLYPDGSLLGLYVFGFDSQRHMTRYLHAEKATYADGKWMLENVVDSRFAGDSVTTQRAASEVWDSLLNRRQLRYLLLSLDGLSLRDLHRSIGSLTARSEDSAREQLAFWRRATLPLVAALMVFLGVPFVFGSLRRSTVGVRIAAGALAGVGFQMFNATFGTFALAYGIAPWLSALLPAALALGAGLGALRFIR